MAEGTTNNGMLYFIVGALCTGNAPMPPPNTATAPPANPQAMLLVAGARDAIKRSDLATAEKIVAEAERLDAKAAAVVEVRAELKAAQDKAKAAPATQPATPRATRN